MERYCFQLRRCGSGISWQSVQVHARQFADRQSAIKLARHTSTRYKAEVRLTTGGHPLSSSGTYLHPSQP